MASTTSSASTLEQIPSTPDADGLIEPGWPINGTRVLLENRPPPETTEPELPAPVYSAILQHYVEEVVLARDPRSDPRDQVTSKRVLFTLD